MYGYLFVCVLHASVCMCVYIVRKGGAGEEQVVYTISTCLQMMRERERERERERDRERKRVV